MKTSRTVLLLAGAMLAGASLATASMAMAQNNSSGPAGSAVQKSPDPEAAVNQPFMASGQDLQGPPQQFPAAQTPE